MRVPAQHAVRDAPQSVGYQLHLRRPAPAAASAVAWSRAVAAEGRPAPGGGERAGPADAGPAAAAVSAGVAAAAGAVYFPAPGDAVASRRNTAGGVTPASKASAPQRCGTPLARAWQARD